jgi:hypothetical protein
LKPQDRLSGGLLQRRPELTSQAAIAFFLVPLLLAFAPPAGGATPETAVASGSPSADLQAMQAGPELKSLEFLLEGFHIDKKYISMEGPQKKMSIGSALPPESTVWVRSMSVEMVDAESEAISAEFLCHAWLSYRSPEGGGMLTVSQGTESVTLPEGFAFPVPNTSGNRVMLIGMVENNNYDVIDQSAAMKYTIGYYSDEDAQRLGLKALKPLNMVARPDAPAVHPGAHHVRGLHSHHWLVPPGRHTYTSPVVRPMFQAPGNPLGIGTNTRIHFMRVHLHGYGESVALLDKTTGETLWRGYAKNADGLRQILRSDFYSDVEGVPLYRDHRYELEIVYDNPTDKPIDAMGAFRAFVSGDLVRRD